MTIQTLIKGMLPVCQKCREVNGEEPDKCGKREWCKSIFAAGTAHEREEGEKIAEREESVKAREAKEASDTPGPDGYYAYHRLRFGAEVAGTIKRAIRARGKA